MIFKKKPTMTEELNTYTMVLLQLSAKSAEELRAKAHHWLILHGRYVCTARKPKCQTCGLQDYCREYVSENLCL